MGLWFSSQVKLLNHDATHRNPQETSWYLPKGTSTSEIKWGGEGTMMLAAYCQHQFRFQMSLPEQINGTSDPRRPIFLYKGVCSASMIVTWKWNMASWKTVFLYTPVVFHFDDCFREGMYVALTTGHSQRKDTNCTTVPASEQRWHKQCLS